MVICAAVSVLGYSYFFFSLVLVIKCEVVIINEERVGLVALVKVEVMVFL